MYHPLEAQTPIPLSCHFSTIHHPLLKGYISPQHLTASLDFYFSIRDSVYVKN